MISAASSYRETANHCHSERGEESHADYATCLGFFVAPLLRMTGSRRGSTLAAALALVFLIFAVTTILLARVASIYSDAGARRGQTCAIFLADAGIQKAAHRLAQDRSYTGEKATRLPTGSFDVSVTRGGAGYAVTSTGYAESSFRRHPKRTIHATILVTGRSFRIVDWRENR